MRVWILWIMWADGHVTDDQWFFSETQCVTASGKLDSRRVRFDMCVPAWRIIVT